MDGAAGDGIGGGCAKGNEKYTLLYCLNGGEKIYVCGCMCTLYMSMRCDIYILCIISVRHSFLCGPFRAQQKASKQHFTHLLNHIN